MSKSEERAWKKATQNTNLRFEAFNPAPRLESIKPDLFYLLDVCKQIYAQTPEGEEAIVILPVDEPIGTKKNRARVDRNDKTCPLGLVLKGDSYARHKYAPNAAAKFKVDELMPWLAMRTLELMESQNRGQ